MHADDVIYIGELEIRTAEGLVVAAGQTLKLSVREFQLLVALASRPGHVIRRETLFDVVWGGELRPGDLSIDVYIRKLRVKLEQAVPHRQFIHTHVGFGYRLQPELSPHFHNQDTDR